MNQNVRSGRRVSTRALFASLLLALALPAFVQAADVTAPSKSSKADTISGVVNLNTASSEELQLLPGVGEAKAKAIIERRKLGKGFESVEQLVEVRGIGEKLFKQLRPHLRVSGKTTVRRL